MKFSKYLENLVISVKGSGADVDVHPMSNILFMKIRKKCEMQ